MKTRYYLIFILVLQTFKLSFAVNPNCELYINNRVDGVNLYVKFYPISGLYNGKDNYTQEFNQYTNRSWTYIPGNSNFQGIQRRFEIVPTTNLLRYIIGLDGYALTHNQDYQGYFKIEPDLSGTHYDKWLLLGNDASQNSSLDGLFGYGIYNLEIYKTNEYDSLVQICPTITIDWIDFNYPFPSTVNGGEDLFIFVNSVEDITLNKFQWESNANGDLISIFGVDSPLNPEGNIQVYKQYHSFDTVNNEWVGYNLHNEHPRSFGYSFSDSYFLDYPVDGRNLPSPYTIPTHLYSGQLNGYLTLLHDVNINTGSDLTVNHKSYLQLSPGKNIDFMTVSGVYAKMIVQDSAFLKIGSGSKLIVEAQNMLNLKNKSNLVLMSNSEIRFKSGSFFCNEGANMIGNGSIIFEKGYHQINCNEIADLFFQDSVKIILEDSAVVEIPDSTVLHLSGINTTLILNPNSKIKFGINSKLLFDSSATLIAKGATFTSLDSSGKWEGIVLQNSGADSILDCTFSNAKKSLSFVNTPGNTFISRLVKGNVFNVPAGDDNLGLYGENNFRITIQDNVFNMPENPTNKIIGIYLKNNNTEGVEYLPEENEPAPAYRMFLINNTFYNGTVSAMLLNYTSSYIPFYVKGNTFNSASNTGIMGRNLIGTFKDNIISNTGSLIPMGIHLISSSPDLINNTINSLNVSLHNTGSSYPNLSPIVSGGSLSWIGGKNKLTSIQSDNIQFAHIGNAYTNLGENKFNVDTSSNHYHIYGYVNNSVNNYTGNNNCWYPGNNPRIFLKYIDSTEAISTRTGISNIDCSREINPNSWVVDYMGNGIYDSLKQSADTAGSELTAEQQLYVQGQNYLNAEMYTNSISALKDLTDTYNYFDDLPASVYDLYSGYEGLDTDTLQSTRNTLYGNLKDYLDSKIYTEGDYDASFIANAYNITIMCDANMLNYNNAANAYEFIALYHPDPDVRLNASWDYAEIEALMEGGYGGGERELGLGISELELNKIKEINEMKRINEIISNDPIMSKMKKTFEKISKERVEKNERIEKQINDDLKTNEKSTERLSEKRSDNLVKSEQFEKQKELDRFKNEKAKRNIFELKNLNKQELEKRRIEDLLLTAKDERNTVSEKNQNFSNTINYKLYQNFPNPFNPTTKINYEIGKSGIVVLKVYNVLGKEIKTLVNEFKSIGNYFVDFDGSGLSSGVYYYKLETRDYSSTNKMLLIK